MKRLLLMLLVVGFVAVATRAQEIPQEMRIRQIEVGQATSDSLASTDAHAYSLDLEADRFIYGEVNQLTVDVVVTVYGPGGEIADRFDSPARGPEPFQFTSDAAGTYRIEVTPFREEQGRYVITLTLAEPLAETPQERVDQLMAAYRGDEKPGGVVAVVSHGEIDFARGYGMANLEYAIPNTPETPYHMASVSKQFTAFAIAVLAEQGKISLDDDVRTHLPELHDFGTTITLRHLLTHTSGLRDQWELWRMSGGRMDDVIRQEDLMRLIERQRELNFEPGSEFLYSNTGYMLAAQVVERVTGEPFGVWMRENVFDPLGMRSTQIYDDHERLVKGRAYSYRYGEQGSIEKSVLSYANAGATSLFTTAEDLAKWLRNFKTAEVGGAAVAERMQERGVLTKGDTLDYALGIGIDEHRGLRRIQHGGADAGYRTMLAYYPEIDAGVAVLGNVASFSAGRIAEEVAEAFFASSMTPEEPTSVEKAEEAAPEPDDRPDISVPPQRLDAFAGTYRIEGGPILRLAREGETLVARIEGQPAYHLTALADTLFRVPDVDVRISFHAEPDGRIERATVHQNGDNPMRRIEPWRPGADDLEPFAGRYYSPELETIYSVSVADSQMVARHRRHGEITLTPTEEGAFTGRDYFDEVRFTRDEAGAVTGMLVSNGRVRNLRFDRTARSVE